jgi:CheY-like chemotaxis protein
MLVAPHNLLVVDDEFASLEVLSLLLNGEGFRVFSASNGEEALKRLAEAEIALVVTDYKMPKMDGAELCRSMLADPRYRAIPVILTSGTYRHDRPRPENVAAFLGKPLRFPDLLDTVNRILKGASAD